MSAPASANATADRLLNAAGAARIGARDDDEVGIGARRQRLLQLLDEEFGRHQVIDANVMLDPARQQLVLDLDGRKACRFRQRDGAVDVNRIAPSAAGVEHQRQLAGRADVDCNVRHLGDRDIGLCDVLHPAQRAAGKIDRLETGLLRQQRHDRIAHHRRNDQLVSGDQVLQLLQIMLPLSYRLLGVTLRCEATFFAKPRKAAAGAARCHPSRPGFAGHLRMTCPEYGARG
jgi:hypothetical protein